MILGNKLILKNATMNLFKIEGLQNSFVSHKSLTKKDFSNVRNIGRQVYREKKVGEKNPLSINIKDKYKNNFENILMTIMNNKAGQGKNNTKMEMNKDENEEDSIIEIKKETKILNVESISDLKSQKMNKSSSTSDDSCEDVYERAELFQRAILNSNKSGNELTKILMVSRINDDPVFLRKNSLFNLANDLDEFKHSEFSCEDSDDEFEGVEPEKEEILMTEKL